MDCSTPGFPVHHHLPELAQTHVYRVGDAIQPFHLLSSHSPTAFSLCQYQSLFQGVRSSHQVANVLEFQLQHQSCILSPCLFNLYAEYIMQNARLDEAQAGIKIAGRNINNLRYADDTTLMAESTWIFNEYSELISFRIEWFDLFAVQGTLKSLLQHHSSKASILQHSVFFMIQLSHPYMITGKTIALTIWIFVNKVMSLLYNTCYLGLS